MERLLLEIQGMDRNANLDGDTLRKYIERYGKEVAKNVRHKAYDILNEETFEEDPDGVDKSRASHRIMNIQFEDVKPK